ncbi:MAG: hypothetical protein ABIX28_14670 [Vicinamibacterales bacterium]
MQTSHSTPVTTGRVRRRLIGALLAIAVSVGTIAGTATPAHAASSMYGCFRMVNGRTLPGLNVQVQFWTANTWLTLGTVATNATGCVYLPLNGDLRNQYVRFNVNTQLGGTYLYSAPNVFIPYAYPGNLPANVGTAWVTCSGFCSSIGV